MPPCRGQLCLISLSQCVSRSSSLGPPLWLGARACLCLTPGPVHVCISLSLSPWHDVLSLSPSSVCLS